MCLNPSALITIVYSILAQTPVDDNRNRIRFMVLKRPLLMKGGRCKGKKSFGIGSQDNRFCSV